MLPVELRSLVRFTMQEVRHLDGAGAEAVRDAHQVKQVFPGSEVVGQGEQQGGHAHPAAEPESDPDPMDTK